MWGGASRPAKYGFSGCMPAMTSSVEVSLGGGMSENDGSRRWSCSSEKERKRSRISSVLRAIAARSLGRGDGAPAHDHVAAQQAGHLAGGGAVDRLAELERDVPAAGGGRYAAGHRARAVAQLHRVDLGGRPVQPGAAQPDLRGGERSTRPGHHAVAPDVRGQHVERLPGSDAEPAALAD